MEEVTAAPAERRHLGLEQSLSATGNSAGKKFGETRDWAGIFGDLPDSGRQRPRYLASPAAKPPKVKDYSDDARKPELRRTAWWMTQFVLMRLQQPIPC